jgi:hypothetical protein
MATYIVNEGHQIIDANGKLRVGGDEIELEGRGEKTFVDIGYVRPKPEPVKPKYTPRGASEKC